MLYRGCSLDHSEKIKEKGDSYGKIKQNKS